MGKNQAPSASPATPPAPPQSPPTPNAAEAKPGLTPLEMAREFFVQHQLSEDQQTRSQKLREAATAYVEVILANTRPCADQTAAIRKLRELHMTLTQNISLEEVGK